MINLYPFLGVPASGFNSKPFVTSWVLPQYALGTIRLIFSLYVFISISYSYAYFAKHKVTFHLQDIGLEPVTFQVGAEGIRQSLSYFTYLSYWSQSFYFFFAALHTFDSARRGNAFLDYWPRPLQVMHSAFYSCVTAFPFLVSAVYWSSMYIGPWFEHDFDRWSALSIHGLNSVFALFEVAVTSTRPQPWAHLGVLMLIMSLYLPIPYITKVTEDIYIYLWLNPDNGIAQLIAHIIGYAMAIIVIFNVTRGAIWLRCRMTDGSSGDKFQHSEHETVSAQSISRFSSQTSAFKAFNRIHADNQVQIDEIDVEKIGDASSLNIPLARDQSRASSISSFYDTVSRTSTMTYSVRPTFQEASTASFSLPTRLEESHQTCSTHHKRSSVPHVRNFSRPTSQGTATQSMRELRF